MFQASRNSNFKNIIKYWFDTFRMLDLSFNGKHVLKKTVEKYTLRRLFYLNLNLIDNAILIWHYDQIFILVC